MARGVLVIFDKFGEVAGLEALAKHIVDFVVREKLVEYESEDVVFVLVGVDLSTQIVGRGPYFIGKLLFVHIVEIVVFYDAKIGGTSANQANLFVLGLHNLMQCYEEYLDWMTFF